MNFSSVGSLTNTKCEKSVSLQKDKSDVHFLLKYHYKNKLCL